MAKYLPVAPAHIIKGLRDDGLKHDAFYLAHEVVKDPIGYDALTCRPENVKHYTSLSILDNSVIELGGAVDLSMVRDAQMIVRPGVVVLPDVLEHGAATAKATLDAWDSWYSTFGNVALPLQQDDPKSQLMFVPQGDCLNDWVRCLETVLAEVNPAWIGIPRNTTGRIVESRAQLVKIAKTVAPKAKIHLLGFSKSFVDDVLTARLPEVSSIDSAAPLRVKGDITISGSFGRRGDWWEHAQYHEQMAKNVQQVREWVSA